MEKLKKHLEALISEFDDSAEIYERLENLMAGGMVSGLAARGAMFPNAVFGSMLHVRCWQRTATGW